jgi:hypothetical protein
MQPIHRPLNPGSSGSPTRPAAWARGLVFVALATACGHDDDAPEGQGTTEASSEAQPGTTDPTTSDTSDSSSESTSDESTTGPDTNDEGGTTHATSDPTSDPTSGGPEQDIEKICLASFEDTFPGLARYCECAVAAGDSPDLESCLAGAYSQDHANCTCGVYAMHPDVQPANDCSAAAAKVFADCNEAAADCNEFGECLGALLMASFDCPELPPGVSDEVDAVCGA